MYFRIDFAEKCSFEQENTKATFPPEVCRSRLASGGWPVVFLLPVAPSRTEVSESAFAVAKALLPVCEQESSTVFSFIANCPCRQTALNL